MKHRRTIAIAMSARLLAAASGACAEGEPIVAEDEEHRRWLARVEEARERYEAFAARVTGALERPSGAEPDDVYLDDDTLRAGDIVVTTAGLLLFKGSPRLPYARRDFEPLCETRARSLPHRSALLDILRAGLARRR
jgi:hypothetical protein